MLEAQGLTEDAMLMAGTHVQSELERVRRGAAVAECSQMGMFVQLLTNLTCSAHSKASASYALQGHGV